MAISVEPSGLKEAAAAMKKLQKIGATVLAVELNSIDRKAEEGKTTNITNAQILKYLADDGRDFYTLSEDQKQAMLKILADEITKHIASAKDKNKANNVMTKALKKAGEFWLKIIGARIEDGNTLEGGCRDLSDSYKAYKQKKYEGRLYPIGVATGQLLANVAKNGVRNLRPKRK